MEIKLSQTVKNISYSFSANLISMMISVLLTLIVPKALGVEHYGYWQLYVFYTSYVGFFHFGWCDGIYLRYGGMEYSELDKPILRSQYRLLAAMELAVAAAIALFALFFVKDANKILVLIGAAFCCVLVLPRTMLEFLLQGPGRIKEYARNITVERLVYAALSVGMVIAGIRRYQWLLLADIAAKACAAACFGWACRDIVIGKGVRLTQGLRESWLNISVGVKLLLANLSGMLLIGIVRFSIERVWDIPTFGRVSLAMSVSNLMMIFVNAVGIAIFPTIKRMTPENRASNYKSLHGFFSIAVLGAFTLYYPARLWLAAWLPEYAESLAYMALMFPVCLFEGKMSMLINPYMKALRMEKKIVFVNGVAVAVSIVLTGVCVYMLGNLTLSVLIIVIVSAFRCLFAESLLAGELRLSILTENVAELFLAGLFISSGWVVGGWLGVGTYAAGYFTYLFFKIRHVLHRGLPDYCSFLKKK